MFKQFAFSVILGISLLSAFAVWANSSDQSAVVAKLNVQQQLSISAYKVGQDRFIQQVAVKNNTSKVRKEVAMPLIAGVGAMIFGLMCFVLRSSRKRVK